MWVRTPLASNGALAQLGERLSGRQKVKGSNPLSSTTFRQGIVVQLHNTRSDGRSPGPAGQ